MGEGDNCSTSDEIGKRLFVEPGRCCCHFRAL
jgi:hypothetical protein